MAPCRSWEHRQVSASAHGWLLPRFMGWQMTREQNCRTRMSIAQGVASLMRNQGCCLAMMESARVRMDGSPVARLARSGGASCRVADHYDGAGGMVDAMLADRPEQGFDESAVPAAADHQQFSSC